MAVRYLPAENIVASDADLLVNTVNTVGIMGKGVAKAFKDVWPSIMGDYLQACRSKRLKPGGCMLFSLPDGRRWAALATKEHWRDPSRYEWIEPSLRELADLATKAGVRSIAIPPPGCGNGGLDWRRIEPLVIKHLSGFDLRIYARPTTA
ncbi:macro domain-containing protein [Microvirga tunisiensis]|uniref:Macro domain-containing protein n=1 Tax=Microvirga tunisiensis TaxID=2108360 RepID=A0A5N7MM01_9HYPH|nr:macro domain-containing protein [Microvirga tunisiensis]MPR09863.1 macro domain-containing protein [Microvirga tunisiensis]MPR28055.1 macro domain-containing protein [Microvirga tunisiensis]